MKFILHHVQTLSKINHRFNHLHLIHPYIFGTHETKWTNGFTTKKQAKRGEGYTKCSWSQMSEMRCHSPTYFFSNSPVKWRFTNVVLPVPPSPTRTSCKEKCQFKIEWTHWATWTANDQTSYLECCYGLNFIRRHFSVYYLTPKILRGTTSSRIDLGLVKRINERWPLNLLILRGWNSHTTNEKLHKLQKVRL